MSKLLVRLAAYAVNGIPRRVQHLAGLLQRHFAALSGPKAV